MYTQSNDAITGQPISLNVLSSGASLFELLTALDSLLKTDKKLQIDLCGTKMILVKSVACAHCGKQIPIYEPLSLYVPELLRCERCIDTCVHSYEIDEPTVKTIAKYSFASPKRVLQLTLNELGILMGTLLSVVDSNGQKYKVMLEDKNNIQHSK